MNEEQPNPIYSSSPPTNLPSQPVPAAYPPAQPYSPMPPSASSPNKRSKLLISLAVGVVLLLGGLGVVYEATKTASPEALYYQMLDQQMQTTTIKQDWDYESEGIDVVLNAESDFSDPAIPKSKATLRATLGEAVLGAEIRQSLDLIGLSEKEGYVRYTTYSINLDGQEKSLDTVLGKWSKLNLDSIFEVSVETLKGVNTPLGEIITGNLNPSLRADVLQQIKDKKLYTITSSENVDEAGKQQVKYEVTLNKKGIYDVNKFVAEKLGLNSSFTAESDISDKSTIWVDKSTKRPSKVIAQIDGSGTITITYSGYGGAFEAKAPDNPLGYEELDALIKAESQNFPGLFL